MPQSIELRDISLNYGNIPVLLNINQTISPSETVCILGPSGCGKSSLLKVIAGLKAPDKGKIIYGKKDLYNISEKDYLEIQQTTGFIFQDSALISNMSVYDNISLPLRYHFKTKKDKLKEKISNMLKPFYLSDKMDLRPAQLSIGENKLAAIARAIIVSPEIIFYDDPTSNIDRFSANLVVSLIKKQKEKHNITSIITTPDINFATSIADRLFIMFSGEILLADNVKNVLASDDPFVKRIIDAIKVNDLTTPDLKPI